MEVPPSLPLADLTAPVDRLLELAAGKVRLVADRWDPAQGTPVFTVDGRYATRGWTEWTQGFQYGCAILCYDAVGDPSLLALGRDSTVRFMAPHVSHVGVHDHGFNNLSTYGNLRRLMREGRLADDAWERAFYEMAIKASGAVQAARWQGVNVNGRPSRHAAGTANLGYVYSFNGPHSLFVDTMRTVRILGLAWQLGHKLMHENDRAADLLKRSVLHGLTTSQYVLFHGDTDAAYDVRGRTAHEAVFNRNDGVFRCRSTQQGYSPFSSDPAFRGCIVNVSSVSATVVSTNRGDYCISKAGVAMATQLWAAWLAEFGIDVYEVRPGIIATDMTAGVTEKYDALIANGLTVEKRWGKPDDVGRAVAALARGDIPYATGQVLNVDGGLTLQRL